eukprot:scaffold80978_cov18-Tisochrysis_lutea.AAC.1
MDNQTIELDFVKQLDIAKDLASALAYLHAQGKAARAFDGIARLSERYEDPQTRIYAAWHDE